ncbi:MAG: ATP-binding protein [Bacillota bacterium]
MRENRDKIVEKTSAIGQLFKRAYKFIAAAKSLRDDMEIIYEEALDKGLFNFHVAKLKNEILGGIPYTLKEGKTRHLFGSAFSPDGRVDYYETVLHGFDKVVYIKGNYIKGMSRLMEYIVEEGLKKGLYIEIYHEPMDERNIETILIPELDIAITTSKKFAKNNVKIIDFDSFMKVDILKKHEEKLKEDQQLIDELLAKGLANVSIAKKEHDILETFYIPNMNFRAVDSFKEEIMNRIMGYAEEPEK